MIGKVISDLSSRKRSTGLVQQDHHHERLSTSSLVAPKTAKTAKIKGARIPIPPDKK